MGPEALTGQERVGPRKFREGPRSGIGGSKGLESERISGSMSRVPEESWDPGIALMGKAPRVWVERGWVIGSGGGRERSRDPRPYLGTAMRSEVCRYGQQEPARAKRDSGIRGARKE